MSKSESDKIEINIERTDDGWVVFCDGIFIEAIFSTKEKAKFFIKNLLSAMLDSVVFDDGNDGSERLRVTCEKQQLGSYNADGDVK